MSCEYCWLEPGGCGSCARCSEAYRGHALHIECGHGGGLYCCDKCKYEQQQDQDRGVSLKEIEQYYKAYYFGDARIGTEKKPSLWQRIKRWFK